MRLRSRIIPDGECRLTKRKVTSFEVWLVEARAANGNYKTLAVFMGPTAHIRAKDWKASNEYQNLPEEAKR